MLMRDECPRNEEAATAFLEMVRTGHLAFGSRRRFHRHMTPTLALAVPRRKHGKVRADGLSDQGGSATEVRTTPPPKGLGNSSDSTLALESRLGLKIASIVHGQALCVPMTRSVIATAQVVLSGPSAAQALHLLVRARVLRKVERATAAQVEKEPGPAHFDREDADVSTHHVIDLCTHGDHSVRPQRVRLEVGPRIDLRGQLSGALKAAQSRPYRDRPTRQRDDRARFIG